MNQAEAAEAFYAALLEHDAEALYERAPVGYLSTTPDGMIVKVNATFLTWTGLAREALIGRRTFAELLTPGGRIYHETHYAPMLQMQGTAREIAFDIVRSDGSRMPALVNAVLERTDVGAPVVVRIAVFDATERRAYERELLRAKQRAEDSEARATLLARTLQQVLIPPAPPDIPGLELAAAYRPAGRGEEVGGDFYDVFEIGRGDWVAAIGDVCGKGVEAAVVTALARATIRAASVGRPNPRDVLGTLNQVLLHHHTERFCTIELLRLRETERGWTATVAAGGHPLPILARDGSSPTTFGEPGDLLGVFVEPDLRDTEVLLRSGDAIVLYTDGVTEGRQGSQGSQFYGEQRLRDAITSFRGSATSLVDGILHDVLEFQTGNPRDDIAVVVVRVP
ncbi:MAG: histidine kinase [Actinomycetia bacterium]|nr:histidine kinase [Actinomycetes bacterium]